MAVSTRGGIVADEGMVEELLPDVRPGDDVLLLVLHTEGDVLLSVTGSPFAAAETLVLAGGAVAALWCVELRALDREDALRLLVAG